MENSTVFFAYLLTWCGYLVGVYTLCRWRHLHRGVTSASHLVPSAIAILMIGIFLVGGGATVAQFNVGSVLAMTLWSLWFHLWPLLLLAAGASALAHLVWTGVACYRATYRKWIPVASSGLFMSVFGSFVVIQNFPDA